MLPTAWALGLLPRPMVLAVLAQILASAGGTPATAHVSPRDSVRLVRRAHAAQSDFEWMHRNNLPIGYGGGGGSGYCDVRVGRFCYWPDDGDDSSVPAEPSRVERARSELLMLLDSLGADVPGDAWIAGQRVRYRIDAGRTADAVAVARSCAASASWCAALSGLALHENGEYAAADSAFAAALAAMPDSERCRWTDISLLLDGALSDRYGKLDCGGRDSLADRVWWLASPLYLVGAPDLRTEILSRVTRAEIEEHARQTQLSWGDDVRELMLRYGWPTWYSREMPTLGSMSEPSIIGHDPSPSFNFLPAGAGVDSPFTIAADRFELNLRTARVRYAPRYLRSLHPLGHQLSIFRRGDSALVVAAFDVSDDTTLAGRELASGLFLWSAPHDGVRSVREDTATRQVLTASTAWRPLVIGVEVLARKDRNGARARIGRVLPPSNGRISLSDLLLYAPADSTPRRLADVLPDVLPTARVRRRAPLGLFWETYGLAPAGEVVGISLTISREHEGWLHRAAQVLRLADRGTPLSVRWNEKPEVGSGIASRGVTVDLSRLSAGQYRVELTVSPDGQAPVVVSRSIDIVD